MEKELNEIEKMYTKVKPLVEKMKANYPEEINLEGLEPALTNDIAEIVLQMLSLARAEIVQELEGICNKSKTERGLCKAIGNFINKTKQSNEKEIRNNRRRV